MLSQKVFITEGFPNPLKYKIECGLNSFEMNAISSNLSRGPRFQAQT